jgi:hypothetical protein
MHMFPNLLKFFSVYLDLLFNNDVCCVQDVKVLLEQVSVFSVVV